MKRALLILAWVAVIAAGVWLRFHDLASRPFHCDEATGARLAAKRMEAGDYRFDPVHFHGPTQGALTAPLCRSRGENGWREMTKGTLRLLPATAGSLLLLVPLLGRRKWGDAPMLLAAALFATCPLLVYYSRMYIHESLLVLFGMLAVFSLLLFPRHGLPGVFVGLMFATKESFAISIIAWTGAATFLAILYRAPLRRWWMDWKNTPATPQGEPLAGSPRPCARLLVPLAVNGLAAALTAAFFYTDAFRHWQGAIDAVRTFFVYQTTGGHDKPAGYYFDLLLLPHKAAGVWWSEIPVAILAVLALLASFRSTSVWHRFVVQFLAVAAVGHFAIYSMIAYKTPWLACLPWAHVCLLAGFAAHSWRDARPTVKAGFAVLLALCLVAQSTRTRHAVGRLAADTRNPYAYVPTRRDIEKLQVWLRELRGTCDRPPAIPLEPVAVVGSEYWPLPWYLRDFQQIGYLPKPSSDLARFPLVFAVPEALEGTMEKLAATHTPVPRGLREDFPVTLFIRNEVWQRWMSPDPP